MGKLGTVEYAAMILVFMTQRTEQKIGSLPVLGSSTADACRRQASAEPEQSLQLQENLSAPRRAQKKRGSIFFSSLCFLIGVAHRVRYYEQDGSKDRRLTQGLTEARAYRSNGTKRPARRLYSKS